MVPSPAPPNDDYNDNPEDPDNPLTPVPPGMEMIPPTIELLPRKHCNFELRADK